MRPTAHSISMEDLRLALRVPRRSLRLYIQENHVPTFYTFDGDFVHKHHLPQLLYAVARAREEMKEDDISAELEFNGSYLDLYRSLRSKGYSSEEIRLASNALFELNTVRMLVYVV